MATSPRAVELRVGALVLSALAVLIFASVWIVGSLSFGTGKMPYEVAMTNSGGIRQGDRVRVSGVDVGRVERVQLQPGATWPVIFRVALDENIEITEGASARIASEGLLGANYLEIHVGPRGAPRLPPESRIEGSGAPGLEGALAGLDELTGRAVELLDQVSVLLDGLAGNINPLLERASLLFADENLEAFNGILTGMDQLVEENRPLLRSMLQRMDGLSASLEESTADLPELTQELTALVEDLRTALGEEGERLASLLAAAEGTATSAGETFSMLNENRDALDAILGDLEATMANLRAFSQTLRDRPSALIRSSGPKDRRPGDGVEERP